jgi:hypothetical protein
MLHAKKANIIKWIDRSYFSTKANHVKSFFCADDLSEG